MKDLVVWKVAKCLKSVVLGSRFLVVTDEWLKQVGCKRRCFCGGL